MAFDLDTMEKAEKVLGTKLVLSTINHMMALAQEVERKRQEKK
jgi:hypothetical protein